MKGKKLEEVKNYKYLGYTMQRNGRQDEHIKERVARAMAVMEQIRNIRKKKFRKDWKKKFGYLIRYGAEIWGWKEREEL